MHFVGATFQPFEKTGHTIEQVTIPIAVKIGIAFNHPQLVFFGQMFVSNIGGNAAFFGKFHQIFLAAFETLRGPGLYRTFFQRFVFIRDNKAIIDSNHPSKTTAGVASAQGGIEAEVAGQRA